MNDLRADSIVDELLPEELDWRTWVRRYPLVSVSLAALGGYLLARSRGEELVERVSNRAAESLTSNLDNLIDGR